VCREGAWAELTAEVTCMGFARSRSHGICMSKTRSEVILKRIAFGLFVMVISKIGKEFVVQFY